MASPPAIGYWIFNFVPRWEAVSKEVQQLLGIAQQRYRTRLVALNLSGDRLRLDADRLTLPLPYALAALPWLLRLARSHQVNHVMASAGERILLPRFEPQRTILTVAKSATLAAIERNLPTLRRLRCIVVESERDRELLLQGGVAPEALRLIYPGVAVRPYTPAPEPFTVLFATSPLGRHDLLSRGVHLLIGVARELPDVRFVLVWREHNHGAVTELVDRAGVDNIVIENGYIPDMARVYDTVHATVLPGLEHISLKPCPHSAIESLAHGKPLLISSPTSLADLVRREGCGVAFDPNVGALRAAILALRDDYAACQARCHDVVRRCFCARTFEERYLTLYDSIIAGNGNAA